jgi:hypothetical protein
MRQTSLSRRGSNLFGALMLMLLFSMPGGTQNLTGIVPTDPMPAQCGFTGGTVAPPSFPVCFNSSAYASLDELYYPLANFRPIRLRANMYVMQKFDGTGNFSEKNPDDMAFLNDWFARCNNAFSDAIILSDRCDELHRGAKVEFIPNWIFVKDEDLWDNDKSMGFKCPDDPSFHLLPFDKKMHEKDPGAINVYLTTSGSIYHQMVTLGTITDPNTGPNGNMFYVWCSQKPAIWSYLDFSSIVHIPNLYLKYWWFKNTFPDQPFSVTRNWLVEEGRVLAHEFGHSLNLEHNDEDCVNNLMITSGRYGNVLTQSQLGIMHRALAVGSLRQYIPCEENYGTPDANRIVNTNELWDVNMRLFTDVVVKNGATLTITCKVLMPEQGIITVERGGKLIVDGGTVTRANTCSPEQFWRTIAAHGDPANQAQGAVVRVINNGFIEGAVVGVTTGSYPGNDPSLWGATVQVENSTFSDCRKGVEFWPFSSTNASYFKNAKFLRSASGSSHTGVSMWRTKGILFDNCTFTGMTRNGINSFDASYTVQNACRFSGSTQSAIASGATEILPNPIIIGRLTDTEAQRNVFSANTLGIHLTAGNNAKIFRNKISSYDFDLAIIGMSRVTAEKNDFSATAAGIKLENSGLETNEYKCNSYSGSMVGLNIVGRNIGFSFTEDAFSTTLHDMFLENAGTTLGRISNQGTFGNGRWNFFTPGQQQQLKTKDGQTARFDYFYPNAMSRPKCSIGAADCSPNSNFGATATLAGEPTCGNGGPFDEDDECIDGDDYYSCARPGWIELVATTQQTLNSGDNSVILNTAKTGTSEAASNALMAASPYLADAVLLAVAANAGFTPAQKTAILKANAPLSLGVMEHLSSLGTATMEELETANEQVPISERARIQDELNKLLVEREDAINRFFAYNTARNNWSKLEAVFSQDTSGYNRRRLFSVYLAQEKYAQASQVLDQMPVSNIEDQYFVAIQRVNLAHRMNPVGYQLDDLTEQSLLAIAESHTEVAAYAQSLLGLLTDRVFMPNLPELTEEKSAEQRSWVDENKNVSIRNTVPQLLLLSPNPARDFLQMQMPGAVGCRIEFHHLTTGRTERTVYLPDGNGLNISIQELPEGVYVLTALQNKQVLTRQKLVIQH